MPSNNVEHGNRSESFSPATERTALVRPRAVSRATSVSIALPQEEPEDDDNGPKTISVLRGTIIIFAFTVLVFLQSSNFTLMSTTQGLLADDLDAYAEVSWFTSTYLIGLSCMSPVFGRLAQIFSPRHCVLATSVVFAIGALVSSQATALWVLLLGRTLQGAGAAGILTLSIIVVIQLTNKKHRGLFIGLANSAVTAGVALGAVIGGELAWSLGWRLLFWIQSPIAVVSGAVVFLSIPKALSDVKSEDGETLGKKLWSIDYSGAFLLVSCLVFILYGLSAPSVQILPIIIGLALLVGFVLNELYFTTTPIIPVSVLKSRGALLSCFGQMGFMSVRWAVLFYTPIYAQAVRLWSPAQAGSLLIPTNAGFAVGGIIVGTLHIRRAGSFWLPVVICYTIFPVDVFILSRISTTDANAAWYIVALFMNGFFVGAGLNYCLAHMLHLTSPDVHFVATSLLATFRGFSGSFGSAVGGGLFARLLRSSLEAGFVDRGISGKEGLIRQLLGKPALVRELNGADQEVGSMAYQQAIEGLYLGGVGLAFVAVFIQAGTGWSAPNTAEHKSNDETIEEE